VACRRETLQAQFNESQAALAECKRTLQAAQSNFANWEACRVQQQVKSLQVLSHICHTSAASIRKQFAGCEVVGLRLGLRYRPDKVLSSLSAFREVSDYSIVLV
jgi:hypothetical protein